jgi:hypothetical protein
MVASPSLPWNEAIAKQFDHLLVIFHEFGDILGMNLLKVGALSNGPAKIGLGDIKPNQPTHARQRLVLTP